MLTKRQQEALDHIGEGISLNNFTLQYGEDSTMLLDVLKHDKLITLQHSRKHNMTVVMPIISKVD